jgi:hypothetical protein
MLNSRLQAAFMSLPGLDGMKRLEVLQCSSSTATGAIIFHVSAGGRRRIDAIVKTPRDPAADHAIAAEWDIVNQLQAESAIGSLLPAPLSRFVVDGATFYAYGAIAGNTMFAHFRNRVFASRDRVRADFGRQALPAALRLHASRTQAVSGATLGQDLCKNLEELRRLVVELPSNLESHAMSAAQVLSNSGIELPVGRIHGDFSPYNLMSEGRGGSVCTGIIDWEHSEADRPQYLDIFRFISGSELMGRRFVEGGAALRRMSDPANPVAITLWQPWLQRMAPNHASTAMRPAVYSALWSHFFVAAAYREQRRQSNPMDVSHGTYFRGLRELADMQAPTPAAQ